ncbi:MAG: amidohydrolase family protein, partial [Gemmatimonadetes bacterium]|nr:amidohydrolase family protein [Gemmatimonadota bacterium]NIQ54923.1 amidohydrolase family protein [Gemmatimonadota bacterium]NIU75124.1 amidohydrolase family protein [Gammaproteobacteria bacterium]NIX44949.1 amidohydrolase family protein [Gemmatimonadota bacterium]NIY09182.1 amidohydrolase family protein [Gemmatimonadota bacterium]
MRSFVPALLVAVLACAGPGPAAETPPPNPSEEAFDVIIRNGTVYDGRGGPGVRADVGVRGDRIAAVGPLVRGTAPVEVDATGLAVAPGFINMLSWATESLIEDGRSQSDIRQGVTLEVFGEGWSMGPLTDTMKAVMMAQQGDIVYDIEWTTLGEYLEHLEARGVATNVASFVGATTVRIHELGYDDRAPTAAELERMRGLVRQAMEEGALGVGSSLIYAPAFYADTDELIALAEEAGRYGGMYISHLRSEGNALLPALEELIAIAREAGVPAEIYHLKQAGAENWDKLEPVIERIEAARAAGVRITTDMYTYTAGATGLDAAMPPWVQEGGLEEWRRRLQDPEIRARVLEEMRTPTDEWESLYLLAGSPERVLLVGFKQDSLKHLTGKTLAEVAALRGTSPEEAAMDLVVADDSRVGTVYFLMSEENVRRQIALPWMSFGSDAGSLAPEGVFLESNPHPRAYGNFARLLGRYVREGDVIPLREAIRRLTSLPARNLKLRERGELRPGYFADIVVFDPGAIRDHATFEEPHRYATGVRHVFVNGEQVLADGEHTGALPGRVVRGPGWTGWSGPSLEQRLRDAASEVPAEVAVAVVDLEDGERVTVDGDVVMHAASTMKVPVLLELFRQAAAGERSLDERVVVRDSFTSIADGSRYGLTAESDSEQDLYGRIGDRMPLGELARRMIVRSSNLATNLVIEEVGAAAVRRTMEALGAGEMHVLRGVEDIPAYERGMSNTTTARALARVMEV